jgi:hypothetical protein
MEPLIKFFNTIHKLREFWDDIYCESGIVTIKFPNPVKDYLDVELLLDIYEIQGENENELALFIENIPGLFFDINDFLERINLSYYDNVIGILFYTDNSYLLFDLESKKTNSNLNIEVSDPIILNTYYYLAFKNKFKEEYSKNILFLHHDPVLKEFIVLSPEHGTIHIRYPSTTPIFESGDNPKESYDTLLHLNNEDEFLIYLKKQIYKSLNQVEINKRFVELFRNFKNIVIETQKDYSIFLSKFSFETFNKNFRKEQSEYFASIRDILNKIISKVVSIPVSISATIFAINEIRNEVDLAYIVVIAYIVYSLFTSFLIKMLTQDVFELRIQLDYDIDFLNRKVAAEKQKIFSETNRVKDRIWYLITTIYIIQLIFISLSALVIFFSFSKLNLQYNNYIKILFIVLPLQFIIVIIPIIKYLITKMKDKKRKKEESIQLSET